MTCRYNVNMIDLNKRSEYLRSIELFYFAYRSFTSRPDEILEEMGLGRVHHRILYFIGRNPGTPVHGLLKILGVTKQALNGPIRQLIGMELVTAQTATYDRRIKLLTLTDAGSKLEFQLTGTQIENLARTFESVGPEAETGWRKVMEALSKKEHSK